MYKPKTQYGEWEKQMVGDFRRSSFGTAGLIIRLRSKDVEAD